MSKPLSATSKRPQPNFHTESTIDSQGNRLASHTVNSKPAHPVSLGKAHKSTLSESLRKSSRGSTLLGNEISPSLQQTALRDHDKNARDINLNRLGLTEIPASLMQMPLTAIHITHNRIRKIEQPFSSTMSAIIHLDLSFNQLVSFPDSVQSSLSSLSSLNLSFNRLTAFPASPGLLPSLSLLKITGNYVTVIPNHVKSSNLKRIEIEWKVLANKPSQLAQFASLDQCNPNELCFNFMELNSYMQTNKDLTLESFLCQHISSMKEATLTEYLDSCLRLAAFSSFVETVKQKAEDIESFLPSSRLGMLKKILMFGDEGLLEQLGFEYFEVFLRGLSETSLLEAVLDYIECRYPRVTQPVQIRGALEAPDFRSSRTPRPSTSDELDPPHLLKVLQEHRRIFESTHGVAAERVDPK